jgi:hypothetical protein
MRVVVASSQSVFLNPRRSLMASRTSSHTSVLVFTAAAALTICPLSLLYAPLSILITLLMDGGPLGLGSPFSPSGGALSILGVFSSGLKCPVTKT